MFGGGGLALRATLRQLSQSCLFLAILCWATAAYVASAQTLPLVKWEHKSWGLADGSPTLIYDGVQGRDGLLWLSTSSGLYRFDGTHFYEFTPPAGSPKFRKSIDTLFLSRNGVLWAASYFGGVIAIDGSKVTVYGSKEGLPGDPLDGVSEAPDGSMWGVAGGHLYHLEGGRWTDRTKGSGLPDGELVTQYFDREGTLWVLSNNSIFYRSPGQSQFAPTAEYWDKLENPQALLQAADGGLWIELVNYKVNQSVVYQLDVPPHRSQWKQRWTFPRTLYSPRFDRDGSLWLTGKGVTRISFPKASSSDRAPLAEPVIETLDPDDGWSSPATRSVLEDSAGEMWVTTVSGLERFRVPFQIRVSGLPPHQDGNMASSKAGEVLIAGEGKPFLKVLGSQISSVGPSVDAAVCLFQDRQGRLWFRHYYEVFYEENGQVQKVPLPEKITAVRLRQILQLPDDSILFSFLNGTFLRLTGGDWKPAVIASKEHDQNSIMYLDSNNRLWLGDASGEVAVADPNTLGVQVSTGDLGIGTIHSFLQVAYGILAGGEDGLVLFRNGGPHRLRFSTYLNPTSVSGITAAGNGDVWLNAREGIIRITAREMKLAAADPEEHVVQSFRIPRQGLASVPEAMTHSPTAFGDSSGRMWFADSEGVVSFDPNQVLPRSLPVVTISRMEVDGSEPQPSGKVPPGDHTERISYQGADLAEPNAVRYEYALKGVDRGWQDVGDRTEAVYTRLKPGHYTFQVIATSGGGVWTPPASFDFDVLPTVYQTRWFAFCCAILVLAILTAFYRRRVSSLEAKIRERADERAGERIRIARDLHDTLLQSVQGLMLSFHVAARKLPEADPAKAMLETALERAESLIVEGRDLVSELRAESLKESTLKQAFELLAENLSASTAVKVLVEVSELKRELEDQAKEELYLIGREAVVNSFRHSMATRVTVRLDYGMRSFVLSCADNGRGMDETAQVLQGHYGFVGMQERAGKLGGEFVSDSEPGKGTMITVTIPARFAYKRVNFARLLLRLPADR